MKSSINFIKIQTKKIVIPAALLLTVAGCRKLIEIGQPDNTITTEKTFASDDQANSAIAGIYTEMMNTGNFVFTNGAQTLFCGLSSDELVDYQGTADVDGYQFNSNHLLATQGNLLSSFWQPAYFDIYAANAAIEGLNASATISEPARRELTGEAKFIRSFCYFYLTNLFGDVPLALGTDFKQTALMSRTPQADVYRQIIADLKDAKDKLPDDYSAGGGERIRPNKWAATALLARVYLYEQKWDSAEMEASSVINNNQYLLSATLTDVFSPNSSECIWALKQNSSIFPYNGTWDGNNLIPLLTQPASRPRPITSYVPPFYLSDSLIKAFEPNDNRLQAWVGSTASTSGALFGQTFYYAYKYTLGPAQLVPDGTIPQYYVVLRLAEQYLIRAEARAQRDDINGSLDDLNLVRARAGLGSSGATDKTSVLDAILHERQVELFAEWGHRWFDLKRTGKAVSVLSKIGIKSSIHENDLVYPIPFSEIQTDPNLKQNAGY